MSEETEKTALERISEILISEGVEFIVVGGQAEWLFGSPRATDEYPHLRKEVFLHAFVRELESAV